MGSIARDAVESRIADTPSSTHPKPNPAPTQALRPWILPTPDNGKCSHCGGDLIFAEDFTDYSSVVVVDGVWRRESTSTESAGNDPRLWCTECGADFCPPETVL